MEDIYELRQSYTYYVYTTRDRGKAYSDTPATPFKFAFRFIWPVVHTYMYTESEPGPESSRLTYVPSAPSEIYMYVNVAIEIGLGVYVCTCTSSRARYMYM